MRVGIVAFLQESNTFLEGKTTLAHFERELLCEGEGIRTRLAAAHHETGGFFEGLDAAGAEVVPIFAARALPYGVIEADTFSTILARLLSAIDRAGKLDGLLVAPHGATVAENAPDADGHWLTAVRNRVGSIPIMGTLDLHANVSPAMVAACDALIAYRTNPHLDQRQRGRDAAQLLVRTLRGEVRPVMAAAYPPMIVNIERQATAEPHCRELYHFADAQLKQPGVLSNSLLLGFPYADVAEVGAAVVLAMADGDRELAGRIANELARFWWARREQFAGQLIDVATAVRRAKIEPGPVCLLDMGDNVGGGSPGDGTVILHELHRQKAGPSFVCLADKPAVWAAAAAGAGARVRMSVGGKSDNRHGEPFEAEFLVKSLHDGRFTESNPRHGGITRFDQGPTAVVTSDNGLTVMITSERMVPFSLNQIISCGLNPEQFQVLVAKGVHAPVAAYAPVSRTMIRVDTPGVTTADLSRLVYHHRRRPLYPLEPDTAWPTV